MWPRPEPAVLLGLTAAAGWLWGSFLNQLVDRAPYRGAPQPGAPPGPPPDVTPWWPPRSLCFACRRPIAWHDNVPVLSWLLLRGRCRACGAPFGRRTLVLELATPLVWVACAALALAADTSLTAGLWGLAAASWLLVGAARLAERRCAGRGFLATGAVLVGAALLTLR